MRSESGAGHGARLLHAAWGRSMLLCLLLGEVLLHAAARGPTTWLGGCCGKHKDCLKPVECWTSCCYILQKMCMYAAASSSCCKPESQLVLAGSCETVNTLCGFFEEHAKDVEIDLDSLYDASTCEVKFE